MSESILVSKGSSKKENKVSTAKQSKEEEIKQLQKTQDNLEVRKDIPLEYAPFEISTKGKVYAPKLMHIRNFKGGELGSIALLDEDSSLEATSRILKDLIWEDVDPLDFHYDEVIETLGFISKTFWGKTFSIPYQVTQSDIEYLKAMGDERYELYQKKNPEIKVSFEDLKMYDKLPKNFKLPFSLSKNGVSIKFELPRLKYVITVKEFVADKYKEYTDRLKKIQVKYNRDETLITADEEEFVYDLTSKKQKDLLLYTMYSTLIEFNGVELNTLEDKIKAGDQLDGTFWEKIKTICDQYPIGYDKDIEVVSPIDGKKVNRRLAFRLSTILENLHLSSDDGFDFSFS